MAKLDDLIQQKQQRDEDWKAKKTAEREELGQLSDDAVMRVTSEPDAYLHYLDTQAINPRYSASNVMLAMAQNPEITYINSLEVWNRLGRSVNRDENGMKIRVSDTYVKDGREYHGYKIGRVFDISQTHGKAGVPALSLKDNTPEMDAALRRLLDSSPVPVVTSSTMYQDAVYDPKTQSITVSSRLIDSKIFAALSREIVHAGIHDHGRYPYYTREDCAMDAESVSYMPRRRLGPTLRHWRKTTGEADIAYYFRGRGELRRSFCIRAAQQAIISSGVGIAPAHGISETIPASLGCAMRMARLISLRTSSTLIPSRVAMTSMARRAAASCLALVFIRFPS